MLAGGIGVKGHLKANGSRSHLHSCRPEVKLSLLWLSPWCEPMKLVTNNWNLATGSCCHICPILLASSFQIFLEFISP